MLGVRDVSNYPVDHCVSARNKRLLNQSYPWVVKDPHTVMFVWGDNVDCVHENHPTVERLRASAPPLCRSHYFCILHRAMEGSAGRISPLRPGLGFRYTQGRKA